MIRYRFPRQAKLEFGAKFLRWHWGGFRGAVFAQSPTAPGNAVGAVALDRVVHPRGRWWMVDSRYSLGIRPMPPSPGRTVNSGRRHLRGRGEPEPRFLGRLSSRRIRYRYQPIGFDRRPAPIPRFQFHSHQRKCILASERRFLGSVELVGGATPCTISR